MLCCSGERYRAIMALLSFLLCVPHIQKIPFYKTYLTISAGIKCLVAVKSPRTPQLRLQLGVVGWCEGVVYLALSGCPTDIGLQLGKACYPCSGYG